MWAIVVLVYKTAMIIMASSVAVLAHDISGSQPPSVPLWFNASMPSQSMDRNNFKVVKVAGTEHDRLILTASKVEASGQTTGSAKLTSNDEKEQDLLNYAERIGEAASQCGDEFFAQGQSSQVDCTVSDGTRASNKIETAPENDDVFGSAINRTLGWFRESQTTYKKIVVPRFQEGKGVVVLPRDDSEAPPQPVQNEASTALSTGDEIVRLLQNWFKTSSVNYDREILQRLAGMDQERGQEEQRRRAEEQKRLQVEAEVRRRQAEEQERLQAEAEVRRRRAEEQKRLQAEAEVRRRRAEEQERLQAEAEVRRRQAEEQKRLQAEAEVRRRRAEEQERLQAEAEVRRRQAEAEEQPATALTQDRQMTEEFSLSGRSRSQTDDTALQQTKEGPDRQPAGTDQSQREQNKVDPAERAEDQQVANLPTRSEQSAQNLTGDIFSDNDQNTGSKDETQDIAANRDRETAIGAGTMPTLPERKSARKITVASLKTLTPKTLTPPLPERNTYMRTASIQNVSSVIPGVPSRNPKLRLAREKENRSSKAGGKSSRSASDNRYKPSMRLTAAGRHSSRRAKAQADCRRSSRRRIKLPGMYVVRPGDTLWTIARRHYRRGWKFWQIYRANRSKIQNPNMIYPCQIFYIPPRR